MRKLLSLVASTLCVAAFSSGAYADHGKSPPPAGAAPQAAAAPIIVGPAAEGRRAYLKFNCYGCHGMGAAGGGMGPNIVGKERDDVSEKVLQGESGGMPSYRGIVTTVDINNMAAYLQSIGTAGEPKFNDWWEPVPLK